MRNLILTTALLSLAGCGWLRSMMGGGASSGADLDEVEDVEQDEGEAPAPAAPKPEADDEGNEKVDTGAE